MNAVSDDLEVVPFKMWDRINNLGDAFNSNIIQMVGAKPPKRVNAGPHLLAIGSVLQIANADSQVWGSGMMYPDMKVPEIKDANIHAVRGRLTEALLRDAGVLKRDVPLGDPGYLLKQYLDQREPRITPRKGPPVCIIPHHSMAGGAVFKKLDPEQFKVIDLRTKSLDVFAEMMSAEVVLSQSLHGLIFAEALGKPNAWISTRSDANWCFKFLDWFSTTQDPQLLPVMLSPTAPFDPKEALSSARLHGCSIDVGALAGSFPKDFSRTVDRKTFRKFEDCRSVRVCFAETDALRALHGASPEAVPDAARQDTERAVKQVFQGYFDNWSEAKYIIIGDARFNDAGLYAQVERYLDANSDVQHAFLERQPGGDAAPMKKAGVMTLTDTIVIRPNMELSLASGRAVKLVV